MERSSVKTKRVQVSVIVNYQQESDGRWVASIPRQVVEAGPYEAETMRGAVDKAVMAGCANKG